MKTSLTSPFSLSSLEGQLNKVVLASTLYKKHNILLSQNLFDLENKTLLQQINGRSALFAISETAYKLFGPQIVHFLKKAPFQSDLFIVPTGEQNKNLDTVALLCQKANDFGLNRNHPIVAIGGGVCLDICGLAATLFRRGVPHIKIPTTFVGLIDAGIATKNGVNLGKKKNLLGTFTPPEATLIDPTFLKTLSLRNIACGTSESLKMGLIASKRLYQLWLKSGVQLQENRFQMPIDDAQEVIHISIISMLKELSTNLYEHNSYKRSVDFGHSFSQHIEQVTNYEIPHGEAVAIDMAISCQISHLLGFLKKEELDEILQLFQRLHLPCYDSSIQIDRLWHSLMSVIAHRGGNLNLAIPRGIGDCHFLEHLTDLSKSCLQEAIVRLEHHDAENRCHTVVS